MNTIVAPTSYVRCDRCNARTLWLATLPSGSSLAFCGHHFNEHKEKLQQLGAILAERQD